MPVIVAPLLAAILLFIATVAVAQEPPRAPTCEEKFATAEQYAHLVRAQRDQVEVRAAQLAAAVNRLEKEIAALRLPPQKQKEQP